MGKSSGALVEVVSMVSFSLELGTPHLFLLQFRTEAVQVHLCAIKGRYG